MNFPMWRQRLPLIAAAALFAGGNLAFLLTYRSGWETRRETLEGRRNELRRAAETREAEAAQLSSQSDRMSGVSAAIAEFYGRRIGSERESLAPVVGDLHAVLKAAGVSTQQIAYTTAAVPKLPLTALSITFAAKCDYTRFKSMLRAFESSKRWIAVRSLSITRDTERPGVVSVQLELVTYFADPQVVPAEPAKAAKAAPPARRVG